VDFLHPGALSSLIMNPPNHAGAQQMPENDVEKRGELVESSINTNSFGSDIPAGTSKNSFSTSNQRGIPIPPTPVLLKGRLAKWNAKVEGLASLEARGITRVLPGEKHDSGFTGYLQMFALWFGINLAGPNLVVSFLGPLVFSLGWVDCVCIVIFANALSSCGPSYTATFGPQSGNRTMVCLGASCIPVTPMEGL
jgi:Permease for cytosine/purines, uracil, thiamine, allantoin